MPRVETCGGHAEHFLGYVVGHNLRVYGRCVQRTTKSGQKVWQIPRPRSRPRAGSPYPQPWVPIPPGEESRFDSEVHAREVGEYFVRAHNWHRVEIVELPATVACWGCGWIGEVKPEKG